MDGSPSSVLTMGLGDWGSVNLLTTLGYGIGSGVAGPYRWAAIDAHLAGTAAIGSHLAGADAIDTHLAGAAATGRI